MSTNVTKLSKNSSQPNSSTPNLISQNHSLQLQHHPSLEANKDKDPMPNIKDIQPHTTTAQIGSKKLAFLLDPHKDLHTSVSPTHTTHTSPKSFLGSPIKSNKVKVSGSSLETSGVNLISPKDLVRLAMSKHKPKATVKKVTVQAATSVPKNMRKSLSLRFGPGMTRPDKHEGSISKLASNSIIEESSSVSKTSVPNFQDKSAKLKRMKLIYSDIAQSEANRLAKSTVYTPHEVSGRMWQGTLSPNRSNSGLLMPGSPNATLNMSIKNQFFVNQTGFGGSDKQFFGKSSEDDSKEEKSYRKRASVEQIGSYLKEAKPLVKQGKRQEKKNAQARAMTSMDNIKVNSTSFSRVMSNHTVNHEIVDRAKSPVEGIKGVDENEMDETIEILNGSEQGKVKEAKPREEFIADLKNWVNDIVKPQDENQILAAPSKSSAAAEKVKEAQEGLLEKLRGALENDEFVRREDYERLYRERDFIEDELDAVKEENAQLRVLLWKMQEENEAREIRDMEEKKATAAAISNYDFQVQEAMAKQHQELVMLRKRENVVKDLLRMVWKAGIQIGDLQDYDMMTKENVEFDEEQYYQHQQQMEQMQLIHNAQNMQHGENPYTMNANSYYTTSAKQNQIKEKYEHHLQPIGENVYKEENDSYQNGITEQKEEFESGSSSRNIIALSEMGDSESDFSTRQQQAEMMANANPQSNLISTVLKETSNSNNPNALKSKSTADSSPKFSAKLTPQSCFPARAQGNLKIDLTGLGGNQVPRSLAFLTQSSTEKIGHYVGTGPNTVQSLGFHEEFMSKLEEFSLSWRQDALNHQKF